jgi:hypothetical protein
MNISSPSLLRSLSFLVVKLKNKERFHFFYCNIQHFLVMLFFHGFNKIYINSENLKIILSINMTFVKINFPFIFR